MKYIFSFIKKEKIKINKKVFNFRKRKLLEELLALGLGIYKNNDNNYEEVKFNAKTLMNYGLFIRSLCDENSHGECKKLQKKISESIFSRSSVRQLIFFQFIN